MNKIHIPIAAALLLAGCASTSTRSKTDYYGPQGQVVARELERTRRTTVGMKTEASRIEATMTRTNAVTLGDGTNSMTFSTQHGKVFGTQGFKTEGQPEVIKAAGDAVGTAAGAILKKAVAP